MTAPVLWTAAEAAAATGGRAVGDWRATGISIDSRAVAAGDLFVAIRGPRMDGHDFAAAALRADAAALLIDRLPEGLAGDAPRVEVADSGAGLTALARAARDRSPARVAAITGTVGKTGTKEALRLVLADQAPTHASLGNLNNQWGLPLSLARLPRAAAYGVFEIGMNHAGEITPLTRLARPHVAVVTAITEVHMENFASLAAVADAKAEIFAGVEAGGTAVIFRDTPHYERLAAAARANGIDDIRAFGTAEDCWARLIGHDGETVTAAFAGREIAYRLPIPGRHWAINSLAVLAAADAMGAGLEPAAAALADLTPPAGRGRRIGVALAGGRFEVIDESYNASPAAVRAALAVLAETPTGPGGRRLAVLGDMLELGDKAADMHAVLAGDVAASGIDLVFTAGPLMGALRDALPDALRGGHGATAEALAPLIAASAQPGDVILVKGSNGMGMTRIVEALAARGNRTPENGHDNGNGGLRHAV